jgi:hypothetical protein
MEVSGQLHFLSALPPAKIPSNHWIGGCVGNGFALDAVEKRKSLFLPGIEPQQSSPFPVAVPTELFRLSTTVNQNLILPAEFYVDCLFAELLKFAT